MQGTHLLGELLLGGLLQGLLLHDLGNSSRGFLSLSLLELIDLVSVVGMVWVIRVQKIEFRIIDLVLPDPGLKLWSISSKVEEDRRFSQNII